MEWKMSGKQVLLCTIIAANVFLLALIWAKHQIAIPPEAETAVAGSAERTFTEYDYELKKVTETDGWRIEHYELYEITLNDSGDVVSKKPTGETQYMRYWTGR